MKRRIDLVAPPFKGHLIPILGIGRQLAAEYDVRVISSPSAMQDVRSAGFEGVAVMARNESTLFSIANPPHSVGNNPVRLNRQFKEAIRVMVELGQELTSLYEKAPPDLVIADFVVPVAGSVAKKLGIPWWTSLASPCVIETQDGPPCYMGGWPLSNSAYWRLNYALGRRLIRLFKQTLFGIYKPLIRQAGVERLYRDDGTESIYSPERILALGLPELEFCQQWPKSVRFIGPMLYSPPKERAGPVFEAGKRHVLVTLGTHLAWHKQAFASVVKNAALEMKEIIFHFSDGVSDREYLKESGNFKRFAFIDYATSIHNYDLVIHHSGTGVMYHTLAAGKPAIVYPLDYDQFDYAARLEHHGLAVRLKSTKQLVSLIREVLENDDMKLRCKSFQQTCARITLECQIRKLVDEHFLNQKQLCESL